MAHSVMRRKIPELEEALTGHFEDHQHRGGRPGVNGQMNAVVTTSQVRTVIRL